jgi:hypothetical protein
MTVRAPTAAPGPIVTNDPIDTSGPNVTSGAIELAESTPRGGGTAVVNSSTACANATYG